jgi:hypothetical protein
MVTFPCYETQCIAQAPNYRSKLPVSLPRCLVTRHNALPKPHIIRSLTLSLQVACELTMLPCDAAQCLARAPCGSSLPGNMATMPCIQAMSQAQHYPSHVPIPIVSKLCLKPNSISPFPKPNSIQAMFEAQQYPIHVPGPKTKRV